MTLPWGAIWTVNDFATLSARASGGGRMPTIPRESVSGREEQGPVRWEGSPLRREGSPLRRGTTQRGREAFESSRWTTDRAEFGGVGGKGPEETSTLDEFGSMAPCWRLLQRAQGYMVKVRAARNVTFLSSA